MTDPIGKGARTIGLMLKWAVIAFIALAALLIGALVMAVV